MTTPMIIDAHFHAWQLARGDYGWLDPALNPALAPIYRDITVADWQAQSAPHGVTGGVLVQAAPTEAETLFLLTQASKHPAVLGVVGWVDWLAPDAPQRIAAWARHPKLKGLRPMLQDIEDPQWILQSALTPVLQAMADHGLAFDALVKSVHLPHLLTLMQRHPHLRVVIDHCAKPNIAAGEWHPWADGMAQLATHNGVMCKLSGLMTETGETLTASTPGAVQRWGEHVLACFGAQRVMWGSDWPVLELAASYAQWWTQAQRMLACLSPSDQTSVMGENARRFYRL